MDNLLLKTEKQGKVHKSVVIAIAPASVELPRNMERDAASMDNAAGLIREADSVRAYIDLEVASRRSNTLDCHDDACH